MPDVTAELPSQSTQTRTCTAPSRRAQIDEPDEATRVSAALGQSQLFQSGAPSGLQSMLVEVLWRSYPPNGHEAPLLDAQTQQVARGADEAACRSQGQVGGVAPEVRAETGVRGAGVQACVATGVSSGVGAWQGSSTLPTQGAPASVNSQLLAHKDSPTCTCTGAKRDPRVAAMREGEAARSRLAGSEPHSGSRLTDYADEPPKRRYHCLLGHALLHEEGAIGPRVHVLRLGARVVARLLRCVGLLVRRSAICVSGQRGGRWAGNLDLHSTLHALWAHHVHEHAAHVGLEGLPRPHACGDDHVVHLLLRLRRLRWRWLQLLLGHDQRRLWG
mmetsp:Transcript_11611/g.28278  ORF Transcript_11611/g.28278 Transcript_11611/m.28278 type:complete len:331 (+) Transcript_11611:60-1052(+)